MTASIIVTYYDPAGKKGQMLADALLSIGRCTASWVAQGDRVELILVHNGPSYCESVNEGLSRANGDYLVVLNDDIVMEDERFLQKLCKPGVITAWQLGDFHLTKEKVPDAACFAMSRDVFNKVGLMDLRYREGINFEDTDFFFTAKAAGIPFVDAEVKMKHLGNVTTQEYFSQTKWDKTYRNEALFREKWKV